MFWRIAADDSPVQNQCDQDLANEFNVRHIDVCDARILPVIVRFCGFLQTRMKFDKVFVDNDL